MLDPTVKRKLGQVVCHFDGEVYGNTDDNHGIMAVGMIVKGKGCYPSRIVLRLFDGKYAVHEQVWREQYTLPDDTLQIRPDVPSDFIQGDYFELAEIDEAMEKFFDRQLVHLNHNLRAAA